MMKNSKKACPNMKTMWRELKKIKKRFPKGDDEFSCSDPSWCIKSKIPLFILIITSLISTVLFFFICNYEYSLWRWLKLLTDDYILYTASIIFLLSLFLLMYLIKIMFENFKHTVRILSKLLDAIFCFGIVISITSVIINIIALIVVLKDSKYSMILLSISIFTAIYIVAFIIYKLYSYSRIMIIEDFLGPDGKKNKESRAVTRILTAELSRLRRLRDVTNNQRMPDKHLLANYPTTHASTFKVFNSSSTIAQLQGNLSIQNVIIPLPIVNYIGRIASQRISGAVSVLNETTKIITAEMSNSLIARKRKKTKFEMQFIWEVNSSKSFLRDNPHIYKNDMEKQTKDLAGLIFSSINEMPIRFNTEAIRHFTDGLQAYKDALHQPFRRRQLLHDAEYHFRKAVSEDDHCLDAYYDLGIVYLELGLPDQAEKFFNMAIDKMSQESDPIPIYYALADSIFNPIKREYAAAMRKFWISNVAKPFKNLNDSETFKKESFQIIAIEKCYKVKTLCDAIIKKLNDYRDDSLCTDTYLLRSTVSMYLGDENAFLCDIYKGAIASVFTYTNNESKPENIKNALVDSMLNFAVAATRDAVKKCLFTQKNLNDLQSYNENYQTAIKATEIAKLVDKTNSEIYYIIGRVNYYFSYFEKSMVAYKTAYELQSDNYNYLGNFAVAYISNIQKKCIYNNDISELENAMIRLFNCPSRIRHEVLEHLAEIPYDSKYYSDEISRENCEKINDFILQAKILTIFAHKMDTDGEAACEMSIPDELNKKYRCVYDRTLFDILFSKCTDEWQSNEFIDFVCKHFSQGNEEYERSLRNMIAKKKNGNKQNKTDENWKEELRLITCKQICGKSAFDCSMNIEDIESSRLRKLIGKWYSWIQAQMFVKIGRSIVFNKSTQNNIAEKMFTNATKSLKDKFYEEIEFQRIYSFYGYTCAQNYNYDQQKLKDILNKLENAFRIDTMDPFAHFAKGLLYLKCNNIIEAHESFFNALSLSPGHEWRPVNLWHEKVIEFHPPELYVYFGISSIRFALLPGEKEVRVRALIESIQSLLYLLDIYLASEKTDISERNKLITKALYWLGRAYFVHGEFEKALEQISLCKVYNPDAILLDYWSAKSLYRQKKFDKAISKFTFLIEKMEKNDINQLLENEKNQLEEKQDCIENAYELLCMCLLYRACCFAGTEDFDNAKNDMDQSWECIMDEHIPSITNECRARCNIERLAVRGISCFHRKQFEEAIDCLKMSLSHTMNSDIVYHLIIALFYHYCTLRDSSVSETCREIIAFVFKVAEEHCLEINSNDMLALPINVTEKVLKLPSCGN